MNDKPLLWEPKNPINQFVFKSITENQYPADLDLLEESVKNYIEMVSQTTNGVGSRKTKYTHNFETDVDPTILTILCEASLLVLSGQLDKLRELEKQDGSNCKD